MPQVETPTFLESPEAVWVYCNYHRELPNDEVACEVPDAGDESRVVIVPSRYFDSEGVRLQGVVIAFTSDGSLVAFPSGDRVTVRPTSIESMNGSSLRS